MFCCGLYRQNALVSAFQRNSMSELFLMYELAVLHWNAANETNQPLSLISYSFARRVALLLQLFMGYLHIAFALFRC